MQNHKFSNCPYIKQTGIVRKKIRSLALPLTASGAICAAIMVTFAACGGQGSEKGNNQDSTLNQSPQTAGLVDTFDAQAHRGGRGLMPENTIASEENAIRFNSTLEMDLQMSKDGKIVVSHDAYFNSDFCLSPAGKEMTKKDGLSRLIHQMDYDSIVKYDVGMKPHPGFPRQKKMHAVKPLLSDLIDSVEAFAKTQNHVNHYNIEIKSGPKADGKHYRDLQTYVDASMKVINDKGIAKRTMIQSFDIRALKMVHEKYPDMATSYLVGKNGVKTTQGYLDTLGFIPTIFSPDYHIVTPEMVKEFHDENVRLIVWTPNTLDELRKLKAMGVDGIITDYPDLYRQL